MNNEKQEKFHQLQANKSLEINKTLDNVKK
jgi:hypothetical protein